MKLRVIGANMTEIERECGTRIFFSYNTPVAIYKPGIGYQRTEKRHSVTTSKHINKWLNGATVTSLMSQEYFDKL